MALTFNGTSLLAALLELAGGSPQPVAYLIIGTAYILFSVVANSLDEALQKFHASGHSPSDALFIIKTETEIYLA